MAEERKTPVRTERGKSVFTDPEGYSFTYHVPLTRGDSCRCDRRKGQKGIQEECKGRIHVVNGEVVKAVNEHSHAPDKGRTERP